ncbi:MAG: hypothetical protein F6K65_35270 [Moorea sp. SIO3C2]|nr:hypothetical protein [Moorena sp. SIO3C2]
MRYTRFFPFSLFPLPYCLFPVPYSQIRCSLKPKKKICTLLPLDSLLLPTPYSLLPAPCSLLPAPCSLKKCT